MTEDQRRPDSRPLLVALGLGAVGVWLWWRNRSPQSTNGKPGCGTMNGRVCVVTGANTGIGKATAMQLAERGAHVVLGCRSLTKGNTACEDIRRRVPGAKVQTLPLDLESFDSVRNFVETFREAGLPLHVLVNNAGVVLTKLETVKDMERTLLTNHLGPFLLTHLLLPQLRESTAAAAAVAAAASTSTSTSTSSEACTDLSQKLLASRIVNVSSALEKRGKIPAMGAGTPPGPAWFGPLPGEYDAFNHYSSSKLYNLLFTFELDRRLSASATEIAGCVTVNAVSPGLVNSDLGRNIAGPWMHWLAKPFLGLMMRNVHKGAEVVTWAATSQDLENSGGKYMRDMAEIPCSDTAKDEELAKKLWEASEIATGLNDDERVP